MAYSFKNWLNSAKGLNAAEKQMSFQSIMSGTAHQREVEDLKKAGLNPVLSANGGAGASTPTGAYDQQLEQENLAALAAHSSSGGYRVAKNAVDKLGETTKSIAKDFGITINKLSENLDASTGKGLISSPMMPLVSTSVDHNKENSNKLPEKLFNPYDEDGWKKNYNDNNMTFDDVKNMYKFYNKRDWYNKAYTNSNILSVSPKQMALNAAKGLPMALSAGYRQQIRWMRRNAKELKKHMSEKAWKDYAYWLHTVTR